MQDPGSQTELNNSKSVKNEHEIERDKNERIKKNEKNQLFAMEAKTEIIHLHPLETINGE